MPPPEDFEPTDDDTAQGKAVRVALTLAVVLLFTASGCGSPACA
jgi:hypothetical protein